MARAPALIVGIVLLLYWLEVVRMALRARRRTGHAANFIPPERLGRRLRWIWQPIVFLWVAIPWTAAFASHPLPHGLAPFYQSPMMQWIGAAGVFGMWIATLRCWRHMGRSWRMGINPGELTPLVTTGPFARVRHPIYALSQAMMICTFLAVPLPLMAIVGMGHIVLLHWEAIREEQHLTVLHGPAYEAYRSSVGRFVPRLGRSYGPAPA